MAGPRLGRILPRVTALPTFDAVRGIIDARNDFFGQGILRKNGVNKLENTGL